MKFQYIYLIICLSILTACGKATKESSDFTKAVEGFSNLKKLADEASKIEENNKKLLNATPIDKEELKKLLPTTLKGIKRTSFSIGNQILADISSAEAIYKNEEQEINFSIMDGVGETASAFINMLRLSLATDFEKTDEYGYEKTIILNGNKAIETVEKDDYSNNKNSELKTIINNRFLVTLKGKNITIENLKKTFNELDLSKLK